MVPVPMIADDFDDAKIYLVILMELPQYMHTLLQSVHLTPSDFIRAIDYPARFSVHVPRERHSS